MVIACDGIWDVLTSQQCVDYVRARLDADVQLSKICEELADECMARHQGQRHRVRQHERGHRAAQGYRIRARGGR